ncbi:MAG: hypothetical protein ACOCXU_05435, partial [Coleofasciculus sp.]
TKPALLTDNLSTKPALLTNNISTQPALIHQHALNLVQGSKKGKFSTLFYCFFQDSSIDFND